MKFYRILLCTVLILTLFATSLIIMTGLKYEKATDGEHYTLRSYRNTVALYKDGKLFETYPDIVLNTLPESDLYELDKGLEFASLSEAQNALEDYDG